MYNLLDKGFISADGKDFGLSTRFLQRLLAVRSCTSLVARKLAENMHFSCGNDESFASRSDSGIETEDHGPPSRPTTKRLKRPNHSKGDDPLGDPQVRRSLIELNITGPQLIEMSVKELNKRLVHCPASLIDLLKRCRRTLKNRGYAKSCRVKRITAKNQLEQINKKLVRENRELKQRNRLLAEQIIQLQNKSQAKINKEKLVMEQQSIVSRSAQPQQTTNLSDNNQQPFACKSNVKREAPQQPPPVDESDPELLSLFQCADTYPSGVELDQIAQSISADGSFFHIWNNWAWQSFETISSPNYVENLLLG